MPERLYYHDPYLREFEATVLSVETAGGRQAVRLDRSAFYPTSGGQPYDVGTLDTARVVDVIDADDGDVLHVVDGAVVEGARVTGRIDWRRRFDHMQQHTGQHVLSAAFDRLLDARTESFHLGADSATIDLDREVPVPEIARAEEDANRIVWEDRPVKITFVDAAEAATLPLRKEPAREGTLRLIDVEGYDLSACGGTHVARTGAIGIIAITGWERFKGGMRVGFVCGGRALRAQRRLRDITASSIRLLSVLPEELPAAVERLQAEGKETKRAIRELQMKLAAHEAAALAGASANGRVIVALDGWDQNGLKAIALAIAARPGGVAALVGNASPCPVVVARNAAASVDCAVVLRQVVEKFGGKGGGRPELAQGGLPGDPQAIVGYLRELL
ncbi:MAG TPA: DHHA1 domain-containing protein [Vicinamibacterales bacterium]|nr:DHHA1 domain-containing protein [Vicinamibacterales bacterium]